MSNVQQKNLKGDLGRQDTEIANTKMEEWELSSREGSSHRQLLGSTKVLMQTGIRAVKVML